MPGHPALPPVFLSSLRDNQHGTSGGGNKEELVFEAVCSHTAQGDVVRVVGSEDVLGCWDPARGIQLHTAATSFPSWTGNILLPRSGPQIEWKLVITRADGTTEWEPAGNRHTKLEPSPEGGPRLVRVHWGGACSEPEPCLSPKHSNHPATLQLLDQATHEGVKALGEPGTPSTEAEAAAVFPAPELTEEGFVLEAAPEDVPEAATWEPMEVHEEKASQVPEACSIRVQQKGVGSGAHRTLHSKGVAGEVSGRTGALNAPCLPIAGCIPFFHSN